MTDFVTNRYDYISLQFCGVCDTAFSVQIKDGNQMLFCRNCGNEEATDLLVVHRTNYENKESDKDFMINRDSRYDVTLPISTVEHCIVCDHKESKFIKVHDNKMALMYFCLAPACGAIWRK